MSEGRGSRASAVAGVGAWAGLRARRAVARPNMQGIAEIVGAWLGEEEEARRYFLWLPVAFGAGIILYFAADSEPALWAPLLGFVIATSLALASRRHGALRTFRFACALAAAMAGFSAGSVKTVLLASPVLQRTLVPAVTAYVETVEIREKSTRLLLRPVSMSGVAGKDIPARIRVTMRTRPDFEAGATIAATMRLLPPPRPSEPGGYDFARDAWFQRIGAVGSISGQVTRSADADVPAIARINAAIDRARNRLTRRIIDSIGGAHGPVAAALVTGKRGEISEETNEALRGAGIYHVVSISGLHMVLAAGLFLWTLRALLAFFPGIALKHPVKTWAAGFAMAGAVAYDLFSGSEVATERSLVMVLVLLGAVIVGRPAFSMRNLAIAALVVLAVNPQAVLGPSFQMSFAAVAAMIAAFEKRIGVAAPGSTGLSGIGADAARDPRAGFVGRWKGVVGAMIVTTLVASLATDPYASYHFHRITPFGLIGNMLTLPIVEFIVMPAAVFGVVANPFGLDGPIWWLMGQGIWFMTEVARWVAGLDGSTLHMPAFGPGALLLMTWGLIWTALWQTPLRWLGLPFFFAGLALAGSAVQPDLAMDSQGRSLAFRQENGRLAILNGKANSFAVSQWLTADADNRKPGALGLEGGGLCDKSGCTGLLRDGRIVALVLERQALAHDCARADIVVTQIFAEGLCAGPELVVDAAYLRRFGATQIRLGPDGRLDFRHARNPAYDRPWSPAPSQPAAFQPANVSPVAVQASEPEDPAQILNRW